MTKTEVIKLLQKHVYPCDDPIKFVVKEGDDEREISRLSIWNEGTIVIHIEGKKEKTILEDFLQRNPNTLLTIQGIPRNICPWYFGYDKKAPCDNKTMSCNTCWNRKLKEMQP